MDVSVAFSTNWNLFPVDGRQVEGEASNLFTAFTNVSDMVHFNVVTAVTDNAVVL